MDRRRFLVALGTAAIGGAAGCVAPAADPLAGTPSARVDSVAGEPLPIDNSEMVRGLPPGTGIYAISEPAFGRDWSTATAVEGRGGADPRLTPRDRVVGVAGGDEARAYPLRVLTAHEVVNDSMGVPLLVTFCPVCASGVVAVRAVDGRETLFDVTGLLWKDNLVMRDFLTDSSWSQIAMTAIGGPATGSVLQVVPSTLTTWSAWRESYPDTRVLLPPPHSKTVVDDLGLDTGGRYDRQPPDPGSRPRPADPAAYDRGPLTHVLGVVVDGEARAYPFPVVFAEGVVNDEVAGVPVVVTVAPGDTLVGYRRRVGDGTLAFSAAGERFLRGGGSRWRRTDGLAVDGPYRGDRLRPATDRSQLFWRSWKDFHPDTGVYGSDAYEWTPGADRR